VTGEGFGGGRAAALADGAEGGGTCTCIMYSAVNHSDFGVFGGWRGGSWKDGRGGSRCRAGLVGAGGAVEEEILLLGGGGLRRAA